MFLNRKRARMVLIVLCVLLVLFLAAVVALDARTQVNSSDRFCLGTYCEITVYGSPVKASRAMSAVWDAVTEFENRISANLSYSELSRVNSGAGDGRWYEVSQQTYDAVSFALSMAARTGGALNPALGSIIGLWAIGTDSQRVPTQSEIDSLLGSCDMNNVLIRSDGGSFFIQITDSGTQLNLGAVGKGLAADIAVSVLEGYGIKSAIINFGGNVYVLGSKPSLSGSKDFKVGLQDPSEARGSYYRLLEVHDISVVSSGSYERFVTGDDGHVYSHIIDPGTGWSIETAVSSVSILGPSSAVCDALSTALFILGPGEGGRLLAEDFPEYCAVFLLEEGSGNHMVEVGNIGILE